MGERKDIMAFKIKVGWATAGRQIYTQEGREESNHRIQDQSDGPVGGLTLRLEGCKRIRRCCDRKAAVLLAATVDASPTPEASSRNRRSVWARFTRIPKWYHAVSTIRSSRSRCLRACSWWRWYLLRGEQTQKRIDYHRVMTGSSTIGFSTHDGIGAFKKKKSESGDAASGSTRQVKQYTMHPCVDKHRRRQQMWHPALAPKATEAFRLL